MIIAVNTICLLKDDPGESSNFIKEVFLAIAESHREHIFILIFKKPYQEAFAFPENVIPVFTATRANTPLKWYIWFNVKIPLLLKKYKAEVFVSHTFCSLLTKVPQCFILYDLSFLHLPSLINKRHQLFYKKNTPHFLKKAKTVLTFSEHSKSTIINHYKTHPEKIQVAYIGGNKMYKPVTQEEKENIKEQYANGYEYFIFTGEIYTRTNLLNLLKAFSAFKKRQKSSMRLLIISETGIHDKEFVASLRLFRFKRDVNLLTGLPQAEIIKIIASAYAMVYPSHEEYAGSTLINTMRCEVPIITSSAGAMPEICGDAALYADPGNINEIAVQMMLIFKDEKKRKDLIDKGKLQVKNYNWNFTANLVWESIKETKYLVN
ncbi:MAG: glycosyltransferase family 1 protein [Ginsengibacter sp.]